MQLYADSFEVINHDYYSLLRPLMVTYASVPHKVSDRSADKTKKKSGHERAVASWYLFIFILHSVFAGRRRAAKAWTTRHTFPNLVHWVTIFEQLNALFYHTYASAIYAVC